MSDGFSSQLQAYTTRGRVVTYLKAETKYYFHYPLFSLVFGFIV